MNSKEKKELEKLRIFFEYCMNWVDVDWWLDPTFTRETGLEFVNLTNSNQNVYLRKSRRKNFNDNQN